MSNYSLPVLILFLLLKNRNSHFSTIPFSLQSLQLESLMDNLHTMIHAIEKAKTFSQSDLLTSLPENLPDMKKIMEVVEKLPL